MIKFIRFNMVWLLLALGACSGGCGAPSGAVFDDGIPHAGGGAAAQAGNGSTVGGENGGTNPQIGGASGAPSGGVSGVGGTLAPPQGGSAQGGAVSQGGGGSGGGGSGGVPSGGAPPIAGSSGGGMSPGGAPSGGAGSGGVASAGAAGSAGAGGAPSPKYPPELTKNPFNCKPVPPPSQGGPNWSCGDDQTLQCEMYEEQRFADKCRKAGTSIVPLAVWVCCHA